jgi:putative spermidine/putrescine transport system permease protein
VPDRRPFLIRHRGAAALALVWALRAATILLLFAPIGLVILLSFGAGSFTTIPPTGYSLRWYENVFVRDEFVQGFLTSLAIAAIVTPASVAIGTSAAYALWRWPRLGTKAIAAALLSPLMLPLVVTGLALLVFFSRLGLYTAFWNIVIGHIIITFPYSMRAVLAILARYDRQVDEAAASVGASPVRAFVHVTVPIIRPGLFAGALFAFVMSFDDFAVTIFLIDANTKTLPVTIYQYMEWNLDPTVSAVSSLLVFIAVVGTLLIERVIGLERFIGLRS